MEKRRPKIYMETTMFNYFFDKERDEHPATLLLFKAIKDGEFDAYTSVVVLRELEKAPEPKRTDMINLINEHRIHVLKASDEAVALEECYIRDGIIPAKFKSDASHLSIATFANCEIIFSCNFTHINRAKTQLYTTYINGVKGFNDLKIYSPREVL